MISCTLLELMFKSTLIPWALHLYSAEMHVLDRGGPCQQSQSLEAERDNWVSDLNEAQYSGSNQMRRKGLLVPKKQIVLWESFPLFLKQVLAKESPTVPWRNLTKTWQELGLCDLAEKWAEVALNIVVFCGNWRKIRGKLLSFFQEETAPSQKRTRATQKSHKWIKEETRKWGVTTGKKPEFRSY